MLINECLKYVSLSFANNYMTKHGIGRKYLLRFRYVPSG